MPRKGKRARVVDEAEDDFASASPSSTAPASAASPALMAENSSDIVDNLPLHMMIHNPAVLPAPSLPARPFDRQRAVHALGVAMDDPTPDNVAALRASFSDVQQVRELLAAEGNTVASAALLCSVAVDQLDHGMQEELGTVCARLTALEVQPLLGSLLPADSDDPAADSFAGSSHTTANAMSDGARLFALEKAAKAETKKAAALTQKVAEQGAELAELRRETEALKAENKTLLGIPKLFAKVMMGQLGVDKLTEELARMGLVD